MYTVDFLQLFFSVGQIRGDIRGVVGVKSSVARCVGRSRRTPQRSTPDHADPVALRRHEVGYGAVVFRLVAGLERWCPVDRQGPINGALARYAPSFTSEEEGQFSPRCRFHSEEHHKPATVGRGLLRSSLTVSCMCGCCAAVLTRAQRA